jgi:hypothetical protein
MGFTGSVNIFAASSWLSKGVATMTPRPVCPFLSAPPSGHAELEGLRAGSSCPLLAKAHTTVVRAGILINRQRFGKHNLHGLVAVPRSPRTICAPAACLRGGSDSKEVLLDDFVVKRNFIIVVVGSRLLQNDFSYLSTIEETCLGCNSPSCSKKVANLRPRRQYQ